MKDLYSILYNLRNSNRVVYEIVSNDENIRYKNLIRNISNLDIDLRIKKFFIDQIEFKTGSYTYKDLYKLVNEYIIKIRNNNNCPYHNLYPIIIDEKTYINNIALFIACLKLNLKPVCIEYEFIPQIEDRHGIIKDHSFGVCSSGSVKKKIISLYEEKAINNIDSFITNNRSISYCTNTITGIVGISSIILEPLTVHSRVIINNKNNFFKEISNRKNITHVMLPVDFIKLLNDSYNFNPNIQFIIGGSYVSPNDIHLLMNMCGLNAYNICLVYGQTETYGLISKNNLSFQRGIILSILDRKKFNNNPHVYKNKIFNKWTDLFIKKLDFKNNFWSNCYFDRLEKKNRDRYGKMLFLTSGKIDPKRVKLSSRPFGEIIVDGYSTGDIGYIDINKYLYVLYRKNNTYSLLINFFESRGYDSCFDPENNTFLIDCGDKDGINFDAISSSGNLSSELIDALRYYNISEDDVKFVKARCSSNLKKFSNNFLKSNVYYDYSLLSNNIFDFSRRIIMYILKDKNLVQMVKEMYTGKIEKDNIVLYLTIHNVSKIIELLSNDCKNKLYYLPNVSIDVDNFINDGLAKSIIAVYMANVYMRNCHDDLFDDETSKKEYFVNIYNHIIEQTPDAEVKEFICYNFWSYFFGELYYNKKIYSLVIEKVENLPNKEEIYDEVDRDIKKIVNEIEELIRNEHKSKSI